MKYRLLLALHFLLLCGWLTAPASAHFLFIQIGPHAEAGRSAEVFFSERATAGDPLFVPKIAHTELWLQDEPGKFVPLTVTRGTDRLRAYLPSGKSVSVIGRCEYGVLKREKPFLLRYYPKAISGIPDEIEKLSINVQIPLEIVPTFAKDSGSITFTLLREGKPVSNAVLTTVDWDLNNEELKADAAGKATWKIPSPGQYAVYAKYVVPQPGTKNGQAYDEIREFATLAFDWPLDQTRIDAEAVATFEKAVAARAQWKDFQGFSALASVYIDGRQSQGRMTVKPDGEVSFDGTSQISDDAARDWIKEQMHSLVIHRVPNSGIQQREKPSLCFADDDKEHPLGRLLTFHGGQFASSYRIRGDEITVVNRSLSGENMSLQMLASERNSDNKVLPRAYEVRYRDSRTGAITRLDTFQLSWQRHGKFDLPESLTQTVSSASGVSTRSLKLQSITLGAETK